VGQSMEKMFVSLLIIVLAASSFLVTAKAESATVRLFSI
jgi:hypothetical protein